MNEYIKNLSVGDQFTWAGTGDQINVVDYRFTEGNLTSLVFHPLGENHPAFGSRVVRVNLTVVTLVP